MTQLTEESAVTSVSLGNRLRSLAGLVAIAVKSSAARASLRRGSPMDVATTAPFFRLINQLELGDLPAPQLVRWGAVVQCMAIAGDANATISDGSLLARAGYSESRFSRLLASHDQQLLDQCLLAARFVHARDHPMRWHQVGRLMLLDTYEGSSVQSRLQLARDYYRAVEN